ncbi:chitin deacetylase 8-like [Plodia interpunctella]|uniref:chitin deacetylase 8-like n=1 Tax=Plodia interpunctella TaxID=58824 RepID=UPI00236821A9|nr:chitin deacetylase 8-like [Plodia interpunctella]
MRGVVVFCFLFALAVAQELAEPCDEEACQLPNCRCSNTNIPGGLAARDTPQFVILTFDDAVNNINIETYRDIIYNRRNTNNCTAGATFYVNHEYTDYQRVNELYNQGYEIALHSISHVTNQTYWAEATYEDMALEFGEQVEQMAHFANIPADSVKGIRIPFLQMTGNASFQVMADYNLEYDCSWPTVASINPGLWPYTLDYASTQDCVIPPCPTASIPGVWVLPMVTWRDLNNNPCSMVDSCLGIPSTEDEWYQFILENFERHYLGNRAPFGFYIHEWYIRDDVNPHVRRALRRFLDLINNLYDVFMVNSKQVIDWVKNPVPLNEYIQQPCRTFTPTFCSPATCPVAAAHNLNVYWMSICNVCPRVYPWLGNPLGQ